MKLASFSHAGKNSWGAVEGVVVVDLGAHFADTWSSLRQFLASGLPFSELQLGAASARRISTADVRWLPVIPDPGKII